MKDPVSAESLIFQQKILLSLTKQSARGAKIFWDNGPAVQHFLQPCFRQCPDSLPAIYLRIFCNIFVALRLAVAVNACILLNMLRKCVHITRQAQKVKVSANPKFQTEMSVPVKGKLIATHLFIRLVCQALPSQAPQKCGKN